MIEVLLDTYHLPCDSGMEGQGSAILSSPNELPHLYPIATRDHWPCGPPDILPQGQDDPLGQGGFNRIEGGQLPWQLYSL